ncbi:MAG TPA: MFS transporter [Solirubrobacteraceae bacterium]|nr:MFS transporter [Solirubrobacteraceae bacterium]
MTRCLRLPVFRRLVAAYVLNELAWSVGTLALSLLVYRQTRSALGAAAFFIFAQFLPAFLSPPLVARLDSNALRRVLPGLYALEAALFGVLAWLTHHFALIPVLVLALADGIIAATARSLAAAARTHILKPLDLLHEGNAVSNIGFSAAFMAGPAIGGLVVAAGGTLAALVVNCGLFAGIALVLAITVLPEAGPSGGSAGSGLGRLVDGLAHVRRDRLLSRLMSVQAVGLVFFTVTIPVEVVYAQHTLRAGPGGYGALMSAWGLGAVAGSGAYARWRRRSTATLIAGSGISLAAGFALMAVAPTLAVAVIGAGLAGVGNGVESIAAKTAVQEQAPEHWMALVMSLNDSISQLAPGLGILLGGLITALASSRVAFAVAATGSLTFALAVPVVLRRAAALRADRTASAGPGPVPGPGSDEGEAESRVSGRKSLV